MQVFSSRAFETRPSQDTSLQKNFHSAMNNVFSLSWDKVV